MKLQDALRKVIRLSGMAVIQDKRLLDCLSDYRAFDEFPAVRPVMSAIAEEGYGKELFSHAADESDADYLRFADELKNTLCVRKNFRKEFAVYAVDCISFALGLVSSVKEPDNQGYDPAGSRSGSDVQCGSRHAGQRYPEDAESLYRQGLAYKNGDGVDWDDEKAVKFFSEAAEQGHAGAQYELGEWYSTSDDEDDEEEEAAKWYRKAAWQGHADAQFKLGKMYYYGIGDDEEDEVLSVKWWRKAAEQGHAEAQYQLGYAYQHGIGVERDDDEAEKWYNKAAENGNSDAMEAVDRLYSKKNQD